MSDIFNISYIATIIAGVSFLFIVDLYRNRKNFRKAYPIFNWSLKILKITADSFKFKRRYRKYIDYAVEFGLVVEAASMAADNPNMSRVWINKFLLDTRKVLELEGYSDEAASRVSRGLSIVLAENKNILLTLSSLLETDRIEVKKITLMVIDLFGECFDVNKNEVDREVYKVLVVAVNLVLLSLKENGPSEKFYTELAKVLNRLNLVIRKAKGVDLRLMYNRRAVENNLKAVLQELIKVFSNK